MAGAFKKWRESASLIIAAKSAVSAPYNYQVLCLKRSSKSGFMPNTYVFPGGNKSKSDADPKWLRVFEKAGFAPHTLQNLQPKENIPAIMSTEEGEPVPKYVSLRICALRETFEECGILLCRDNTMQTFDDKWAHQMVSPEILEWQKKVHNNPNEFINLCDHLKVIPDLWSLKLWSNWITPPSMSSLFNAVFFITTFRNIPETRAEEIEVQDLKWCNPDEYLQENKSKTIMFPPPQYYELCRLRNFQQIEPMSDFVHDRSAMGCESQFPYRVKTKEGVFSILPGDDLYPEHYDKDNKEVPKIDHLADSHVKNRVQHVSEYVNKLYLQNYKPKDGHMPPKIFA